MSAAPSPPAVAAPGSARLARRRLTRGFLGQIYTNAVMMIGQIVLVPVLMLRWSAAGYGEWIALSALAQYITYANVGIPGAVRADMARAFAEGARERMAAAFRTSLLLVAGLSVLAALLLQGAAFALPLPARGVTVMGGRSVQLAVFALFSTQVVLLLSAGVLQAALGALGDYGLASAVEANRQLAEMVSTLVLVGALAQRPLMAAAALPTIAVLYVLALLRLLHRRAPWLLEGRWRFDPQAFRRLRNPMLGVAATSFGYYGMTIQAPRVIIAWLAGPAAAAAYAVCTMLMRMARIPVGVVAHAPTVEISLAWGEGDQPAARRLLVTILRLTFWIGLVLVPVLVVVGPEVVHLWSAGRVAVARPLLAFTAASAMLYALALPCQEALMALGQLGRATKWIIAAAPLFLLAAVALTRRFGIVGMGAAVALLDFAYLALGGYWTARLFGVPLGELAKSLRRPPTGLLWLEGRRLFAGLAPRLRRQSRG